MQLGDYLKKIRKLKNYTQEYVSEHLDISTRHYCRIENNYINPNLKFINKLNDFYRFDVIATYNKQKHFIDNNYEAYIHELTIILNNRNLNELNNFYNKIQNKNLLSDSQIIYSKKLFKQLLIFTESMILIWEKNYINAFNNLIVSIKLTIPQFTIDNFRTYNYNNLEKRILLNLGFCQRHLYGNESKIYNSILEFLNKNTEVSSSIYELVKYNYINSKIYVEDYTEAYLLAKKMVSFLEKNNTFNNIYRFYYQLGVCEIVFLNYNKSHYFDKCLDILKI